MPRPTVVISHQVHPETLDLLASVANVFPNQTCHTLPRAELLGRASDAEGMMVFAPDHVDDAFLAACPKLQVIAAAHEWHDNIDAEACSRRGVWLTVVPDLLTVPAAELAIGLLLGLARHVLRGDRVIRSGKFQGWKPELYGAGLAGSTLGIIGFGALGKAVARRLRGFDMRVVCADKVPADAARDQALGVTRMALGELLAVSDFVLPLVPLTPETVHLIGRQALERMKPGAYLVNVCRGSVVDEAAVAEALASGRLAGYAADVFEIEDCSRSERARSIPAALLDDTQRTLFTPHLGSAVRAVRRQVERHAAESIVAVLSGRPPAGAVNSPAA